MTAHCEWCPFPDCDSCAYKGGDALRSEGGEGDSLVQSARVRRGRGEGMGGILTAQPHRLGPVG